MAGVSARKVRAYQSVLWYHLLIFTVDKGIDDDAEETPSKKKSRTPKGKDKEKKKTDNDGEAEDDNEDNGIVKNEVDPDDADELS